jgi:hypothetical protein
LNKTIIFIYDVPSLSFKLSSCVPRPLKLSQNDSCKILKKDVEEMQSQYRKALINLFARYPDVKTFDPLLNLCDKDFCYIKKSETFLYSDEHHLSIQGAFTALKGFSF